MPQSPADAVISIQSLVERLASVFAEGENKLEAMRARDEYFDRAGKVFDDDGDLFESRMAAFLEWYIIERRFRDGPSPAFRVISEATGRFSADERRAAVHLLTSHRSLFELGSNTGERGERGERSERSERDEHGEHGEASARDERGLRLEVDDLMGGGRFWVTERRGTVGFEPGALFEARLLWNGRSVVFGKTFLFHPPDARDRVLDLVERATAADKPVAEVLFTLSRLYVRWHRFGHLAAAKIYAADGGG